MYVGILDGKALQVLSDVTGLVEWVDYIPVKEESAGRAHSTDNDGYLVSASQSASPSGTKWVDYIPVFVVSRSTPYSTDADGYIPFDDATV
jgi:hypothetical protein